MPTRIIFSDFDGTLTSPVGELGADFYECLAVVKKLGAELIIVSGRSISWGHFLLTHFPIDVAIMEGGGVIIEKKKSNVGAKGFLSGVQETLMVTEQELQSLNDFVDEINNSEFARFLSVDSFGRKTDRAFEYYSMGESDKDSIVDLLKKYGLHHSISNVHLNCWAGEVSKYNACAYYLKNRGGVDENDCYYFGDAPNDESMFKVFKNSVGVSNIERFLDRIQHHPKTILKGPDNAGARGVLNYLKELK